MAELYSDAPWALLARHLAAEATPAEQAQLRAWLRADAMHLQILTTVTRAWERAGEAAPAPVLFGPAQVEAAWQRFRPLMAASPVPSAKAVPATPEAVVRSMWSNAKWPSALLRVAAVLVGVAGAVHFLTSRPAGPTAPTSYASATRPQLLHLPDGSTAWLNAHSSLRYAGAAGSGPRAVQLTGEAYFEVQPDSQRPFFVSSPAARVRVTGTAFNVRAYAAEDSVEVSVTQGRVWVTRLAGTADSVLLTAGTRAALRAADAPGSEAEPLRRTPAPDFNFRAWQTDTLRFRDATVAHVLRTLRAAFGTRIELAGAGLATCRFTGTFAHPQPAQVLAVLALATGSKAEAKANGYVLRGPGCVATADSSGNKP